MADMGSLYAYKAQIYHWFSGIFANELDDKQFAYYFSPLADPWFQQFEQMDLPSIVAVQRARVQRADLQAVDLRADFASAFLLEGERSALPYASFYVNEDKRLRGSISQLMQDFLAKNHLQVSDEFKEPADHLAVFLAFMAHWNEQLAQHEQGKSALCEQIDFLESTLLNWLGDLVKKCREVVLASEFYPAICALVYDFINADCQSLHEMVQEA